RENQNRDCGRSLRPRYIAPSRAQKGTAAARLASLDGQGPAKPSMTVRTQSFSILFPRRC
ncbi:hypothetical protein JG687_00014830, partial [Phytophthora cactorum]